MNGTTRRVESLEGSGSRGMNRAVWLLLAAAAFVLAGAALFETRSAGTSSARAALANSGQAGEPFQTMVGTVCEFPASIPLKWSDQWTFSPDGQNLAISALQSIWVWELADNEVRELTATADDEAHGSAFSQFLWTDDRHILALETQNSHAEAAAWSADHELPLPTVGFRWVLLDTQTGQRLRIVADSQNGGEYGLEVVGVVDADVWYIHAPDGKLRTYDSRTRTVGSEAYFDFDAEGARAFQVAPGGLWFSALIPDDPYRPLEGRLDVFNIQSSERRSVSNVYVNPERALVTPEGRYLFASSPGDDQGGVPRVYNLALGVEIQVPAGERWAPMVLSAARGVLLVGIPKSGNGPNEYDWDYAEVPVSYLIQF